MASMTVMVRKAITIGSCALGDLQEIALVEDVVDPLGG
ncbi:hypothetical protein J2754_002702 [Halarchaeum solikamskense]|nr:hypothetical protein [Halarchaeum solikamskense]